MVTSEISKFETQFLDYLRTNHRNLLDEIKSTGKLSPENDKNLKSILETFLPASGLKMKA
jgi:F-type H+-transporting ATPase subunit alpha